MHYLHSAKAILTKHQMNQSVKHYISVPSTAVYNAGNESYS